MSTSFDTSCGAGPQATPIVSLGRVIPDQAQQAVSQWREHRADAYGDLLAAARTFRPTPGSKLDSDAAQAPLRAAAARVELYATNDILSGPLPLVLKAAEQFQDVLDYGGASPRRIEELIEDLGQATTALRDSLRADLEARDEPTPGVWG